MSCVSTRSWRAATRARARDAPNRAVSDAARSLLCRPKDITHYKPSTVTRRIERRLALAESHTFDEYVQRLARERDELDVLYRDLLIGVTRFFRVLPDLVKRAGRDVPLRIWVAGCATGEEAYSIAIAIAIQEVMAKHGQRPVKIRLIALTGYGRASDRAAAVEAGFDAHLVKPVDTDRLLTLISASASREG